MIQLISTAPAFTRPNDTTAYASGDLVANNTAAASVVPLVFKFDRTPVGSRQIRRFNLLKSGTGVTTAAFRLHLFTALPTFTSAGDNSAISTVAVGNANYLGSLDITAMTALSDGAFGSGIPVAGNEVIWQPSLGVNADGTMTIWGFIEARGAYTPAAQEIFTASIHAHPIPE